ncbi:MAG: alpha/beta hydrolase, partial [Gemmatimonadota bacterium]|nr:alpha/beta hydrolase [Gemmatimonadota bacterium]
MKALLVHGMGRSPASMVLLGQRLGRAGMLTSSFGYVPAIQSFDSIATRLTARLTTLATGGEYIVVGHSLGGLLLRAAIDRLDPSLPRPNHLFMLATPNQSPRLARRFQRNPLYRIYTGDAGQLLADADRLATIPQPSLPTTIIAGVSGRVGLGSPFQEDPNDWIVSLSEVRLTDGDDLVTLNAGHSFLMNYREVMEVILDRVAGGAGGPRGGEIED